MTMASALRTLAHAALILAATAPLAASCMTASLAVPGRVTREVPLDRDRPQLARVGELAFLGAIEFPGGIAGGLSGLVIAEGGERFVAVSDTGRVFDGRLLYGRDGRLVGAADVRRHALPVEEGSGDGKRHHDSEDLTRLPDGSWLVSFEREHRILRYRPGGDRPDGVPVALPTPPGLEGAPDNGGVEALAALPDGRVLAIEEGESDGRPERQAWIGRLSGDGKAAWSRLTYRAAPFYRPTAAAALPSGDVLVVERRASLLGGLAARLVHVPASALRPGGVVEGGELARLDPPLLTDNFEGVAVSEAADGTLRVYVLSDDNFSPLQRTLLLMFALPAGV